MVKRERHTETNRAGPLPLDPCRSPHELCQVRAGPFEIWAPGAKVLDFFSGGWFSLRRLPTLALLAFWKKEGKKKSHLGSAPGQTGFPGSIAKLGTAPVNGGFWVCRLVWPIRELETLIVPLGPRAEPGRREWGSVPTLGKVWRILPSHRSGFLVAAICPWHGMARHGHGHGHARR